MSVIQPALLLTILFAAGTAQARIARTYETVNSTLIMKGMAHSCLTLKQLPDGLPCNPAMTPFTKRKDFRFQGLASDGYNSVRNLKHVVDGEVSQEMVDGFFSHENVLQIEASTDIMYRSPTLNAQLTPVAIRGYSEIHNEANPDIDLFTVEEKGLRFQSGYEFSEEFSFGLQMRVLNRRVVSQKFRLFELGTEAGQGLLVPADQSILFLEPGATFLMGHEWSPRFSFMLVNLGYVSQRYPQIPTSVEPQFAFGISPPMQEGHLDLSIQYSSLDFQEKGADRLHLGALYQIHDFYYSAGIDGAGASAGVHYEGQYFNGGLVFASTRTLKERETVENHNLYFQLGLRL